MRLGNDGALDQENGKALKNKSKGMNAKEEIPLSYRSIFLPRGAI